MIEGIGRINPCTDSSPHAIPPRDRIRFLALRNDITCFFLLTKTTVSNRWSSRPLCSWELAMLSTTRIRALERAIGSSNPISLPSFLLPAFQTTSSRSFSATSQRESQIGKAPLSIPPEVNFTVIAPPKTKNGRQSPLSDRPMVSIEGPRGNFWRFQSNCSLANIQIGKLSMTIPPFVKLEHDELARKAVVSVQDREERKQREMWG